jgi:DNA-binding MarR family transcriptional regulator
MGYFRAGYLIADAARLARQIFFKRRTDNFLTQSQVRALSYISLSEGIRQVELAEMLDITPMSVTKILDQLVDKGLIERHQDSHDRRAFSLVLKPDAHIQLEQMKQESETLWREVLQGIEPEELAVFLRTLNDIRNNLAAIKHRQA